MSSLRVTTLRGRSGNESPSLPDGVVITGIATATGFSGNLTGNVTGNVTGNATGLSGSPNLNVGVVTATSFEGSGSNLTGLPEGTNILKAMLFV
jgi:hypothetical protein